MNTWKKRPVTLIVADSGPLISLACADELQLLQSFGRPVVVADVVRKECTRKLGAPGEERLANWFETAGGNQFRELRTPFLPVFIDAMAQEASGENPDATVGLGDAAIAWVLKNLPRLRTVGGQPLALAPDEIALVLTEDGPYGDGPVLMQRRAHVLSTRQWLKTLERLDVIPSSQAIIDEIQAGGRRVARYMADRPAEVGRHPQRLEGRNRSRRCRLAWRRHARPGRRGEWHRSRRFGRLRPRPDIMRRHRHLGCTGSRSPDPLGVAR